MVSTIEFIDGIPLVQLQSNLIHTFYIYTMDIIDQIPVYIGIYGIDMYKKMQLIQSKFNLEYIMLIVVKLIQLIKLHIIRIGFQLQFNLIWYMRYLWLVLVTKWTDAITVYIYIYIIFIFILIWYF